jgi:hypothetical protein
VTVTTHTLQVAWSGVAKPGKTLRMPAFPQERYMTYQAIINGARSLGFYGGNIPDCWSTADAALGWNWTYWNKVLKPVVQALYLHWMKGTKEAAAAGLADVDDHAAELAPASFGAYLEGDLSTARALLEQSLPPRPQPDANTARPDPCSMAHRCAPQARGGKTLVIRRQCLRGGLHPCAVVGWEIDADRRC